MASVEVNKPWTLENKGNIGSKIQFGHVCLKRAPPGPISRFLPVSTWFLRRARRILRTEKKSNHSQTKVGMLNKVGMYLLAMLNGPKKFQTQHDAYTLN